MPLACLPGTEECNAKDDDCDSKIDEGLVMPCGASNNAPCRLGMQTCDAGVWSACMGAVEPQPAEVCDAALVDENCNGMRNEGCLCTADQTQMCAPKPGVCVAGMQTCNDGKWSVSCAGEVPGPAESCDAKDNDCDGKIDEGALLCPLGTLCEKGGCAPNGTIRAGIRTSSGIYYVGIRDNGNHNEGNAINTDSMIPGLWETFRIEWQDKAYKRFALKTSNGTNYVTARDGGGKGGPETGSAQVYTNSLSINDWEKLILNIDAARGTVTIRTTAGYYLSALDGGGHQSVTDTAIMTKAQTVGEWEVFTLVPY
jgi:hypothetical protein